MAYVKRNYRKRPVAKKSVVKKALRKTKSLVVARICRRVMGRFTETKTATALTVADQNVVNGGGLNNTTGLGYTTGLALPLVSQGVSDGQRIGNVINVKRVSLKYTLRAIDVSQNIGTNPFPALPFLIRIVAYSHRIDKTDNSNTGILETGAGSQNLGATPDYWLEPYNKKEYVIHYSKQYMMQPVRTTFAGTGYQSDNLANGALTFISRKVNLKQIPKKFIYNDSALSNAPTNCGVYIGVAVCNIDGTAINSGQYRAMVNLETYMSYTDN